MSNIIEKKKSKPMNNIISDKNRYNEKKSNRAMTVTIVLYLWFCQLTTLSSLGILQSCAILILVSTSSLTHFLHGDQHIGHTEYIWMNEGLINCYAITSSKN